MIVFKCNYKIIIYYVIIMKMVINTIHTVIYICMLYKLHIILCKWTVKYYT